VPPPPPDDISGYAVFFCTEPTAGEGGREQTSTFAQRLRDASDTIMVAVALIAGAAPTKRLC
jgi:hypothetical protein